MDKSGRYGIHYIKRLKERYNLEITPHELYALKPERLLYKSQDGRRVVFMRIGKVKVLSLIAKTGPVTCYPTDSYPLPSQFKGKIGQSEFNIQLQRSLRQISKIHMWLKQHVKNEHFKFMMERPMRFPKVIYYCGYQKYKGNDSYFVYLVKHFFEHDRSKEYNHCCKSIIADILRPDPKERKLLTYTFSVL